MLALLFISIATTAQVNTLFLRQDTSVIKSSEANWLIPPLKPASNPASKKQTPIELVNPGNTVSEWFLSNIKKGKIKAYDPQSGELIPAKTIYTWRMPQHTIAVYNEAGEIDKYQVVAQEMDPRTISSIRIQQDWWLDLNTSKIYSRIVCIELMRDVYSPPGDYRSRMPFCRINY